MVKSYHSALNMYQNLKTISINYIVYAQQFFSFKIIVTKYTGHNNNNYIEPKL